MYTDTGEFQGQNHAQTKYECWQKAIRDRLSTCSGDPRKHVHQHRTAVADRARFIHGFYCRSPACRRWQHSTAPHGRFSTLSRQVLHTSPFPTTCAYVSDVSHWAQWRIVASQGNSPHCQGYHNIAAATYGHVLCDGSHPASASPCQPYTAYLCLPSTCTHSLAAANRHVVETMPAWHLEGFSE